MEAQSSGNKFHSSLNGRLEVVAHAGFDLLPFPEGGCGMMALGSYSKGSLKVKPGQGSG